MASRPPSRIGPCTAENLPGSNHLHHGPIDLIIEAFGTSDQINTALHQAKSRFTSILDELVEELPLLRSPITKNSTVPKGIIAKAMHRAALPHLPDFITPMAAVAGAVADEVLAAMRIGTNLDKAFVNNGGDIALCLGPNTTFRVGIVANPQNNSLLTRTTIAANSTIRGIATSGRHGRSHSLGIADSVTVFANSAAMADAAATIIANAIDLPGHPAITRQPAIELNPDSDLGERLVTIAVQQLTRQEIANALDRGEELATGLCRNNTIEAAFLTLQGFERIVGWPIDLIPLSAPNSMHTHQQNRVAHA